MTVEGFKYQLESLSYRQKMHLLFWGLNIQVPASVSFMPLHLEHYNLYFIESIKKT